MHPSQPAVKRFCWIPRSISAKALPVPMLSLVRQSQGIPLHYIYMDPCNWMPVSIWNQPTLFLEAAVPEMYWVPEIRSWKQWPSTVRSVQSWQRHQYVHGSHDSKRSFIWCQQLWYHLPVFYFWFGTTVSTGDININLDGRWNDSYTTRKIEWKGTVNNTTLTNLFFHCNIGAVYGLPNIVQVDSMVLRIPVQYKMFWQLIFICPDHAM